LRFTRVPRRFQLFQNGLAYDLFSSTHTKPFQGVPPIFLALKKNDLLYIEKQQQWYAPSQVAFARLLREGRVIFADIPTPVVTSAITAAAWRANP
jgi:hypothetical protein